VKGGAEFAPDGHTVEKNILPRAEKGQSRSGVRSGPTAIERDILGLVEGPLYPRQKRFARFSHGRDQGRG